MNRAIPGGPDELTPSWFEEYTGWSVDEARIEHIGVGIGVSSAIYRAHLSGASCPATAIVKLAALDEAAVFTSTALGMYRREVEFFRQLATAAPVAVPASHHTDIDEPGSSFVIVMDDLAGHRVVDQLVGMEVRDAEVAVDSLARWHRSWWGQVDGFVERGLAVPLGSAIYPAVLPGLFAEGWAKLAAEVPHVLDQVTEVGDRFGALVEPLLAQLDQAPSTLLHGDFRADNMMFDAADDLVLLDFQLIGTGSAAYDLAYFITQSLDVADAAEHERALFDRWADGLGADIDRDRLWADYRAAALFCIVYPVVAVRGMDLADPRQLALVETMLTRMARAVDDLDLRELL